MGSSSSSPAPAFQGKTYATPIIIVPAVVTSLVSSLNVVDFLEMGNYVTNEKKKSDGTKRVPVQLVKRKLPSGQVLEYKIVDTIVGFEDKDWDRVVAVFATGQDWQFKGWKWDTPVALFAKVFSNFYFYYCIVVMNQFTVAAACSILMALK